MGVWRKRRRRRVKAEEKDNSADGVEAAKRKLNYCLVNLFCFFSPFFFVYFFFCLLSLFLFFCGILSKDFIISPFFSFLLTLFPSPFLRKEKKRRRRRREGGKLSPKKKVGKEVFENRKV